MAERDPRLDTQLIHAGEPRPRIAGAVAMPIFQSSTFELAPSGGGYHDVRYIRLNNTPNHVALHEKLAAIERAEAALVTASGMAAISSALLAVLGSGDHLLVQECLYGGTHSLVVQDLPRLGIRHTFIDAADPAGWERALEPTTRAIYVESMTNPLLQVADHTRVVEFARAHRLVSLIDNTFATPVNFRAVERGFDLSLHSCTKYLNGHSDIVAGAVLGRAALVQATKHKLDHLGGSLDPHACFLLHRGLKTMAVRVRHQNASALAIARFLEQHPAVRRVHHPGLESHPHHKRAQELFAGFGGTFSFELHGDVARADRFIAALELPVNAPSLGGVDSLVTRPALTSHAGLSAAERQRAGIADTLVRLSVGLEATEDLVADLARALQQVQGF
jgi:cystathionine beta-lyase/cystathionine gamma-synthase